MAEKTEKEGGIEFLYLYDVRYANPNGDPNNNNSCRQDHDTERILVTPYRKKRTVRDYAFYYKGYNGENGNQDILVRKVNNKSVTNGERVEKIVGNETEFDGIVEKLNEKAIDFRWFGALITAKNEDNSSNQKKSGGVIGPIQLGFGMSLHRARCMMIKGTSVFASEAKKKSGTMTEYYVTPYALIAVPGRVNRALARALGVNLSENDIDLFFEYLWKGTLMLKTTSKNQMPRFLVRIDYKDEYKDFFIGDLEDTVKVVPRNGLKEEAIRSPSDYCLDVQELCDVLKENENKIETIRFCMSPRINIKPSKDELISKYNWELGDMYNSTEESKKEGQP